MRYRLIAVDLDDTLLDAESKISPRNREAIRGAVAAGVKLVIATGRMFKTSVPYLEDLGLDLDRPIINYHGALVQNAKSRDVLLHYPIANELAVAVAEEAAAHNYYVSVFIDDQLYTREKNEYTSFYQSMTEIEHISVGSLSAFLSENKAAPTKMSIINWDGTIDRIEEDLRQQFGDHLAILQSRPNFLELTDRKATKGQSLSWLAEQEGVPREAVIAFGDGANDLDMIAYAGLGVAVANARPELKARADLVTAANTEDGVAAVIEEYILNSA